MPFPTLTVTARRLYDQAASAQEDGADEARGWPLAKLSGALLDGADWLLQAFDADPDADEIPGSRLLDPDLTPAVLIGWLAQFPGVRVTQGAPEAVQRDEVATAAGRKRGRRTSMIADTKRTLTGAKFVAVVQFVSGNRWRVAFRTLPAETPDPAATLRAATGQKPYGIVLEHVVSDSPLWDEGLAATWNGVDAGVTWDTITTTDVGA